MLETLVAVTILALAVAGPLYVANRAYVAAQISADQLTASFLAQEGVEYVRGVRDYEYLARYRARGPDVSQEAWDAFVADAAACDGQTCALDPYRTLGFGRTKAVFACGGSCPHLQLSGGQYQLSSGPSTIFIRSITTDHAALENVLWVRSVVSWENHGIPYSVTSADYLTPWQ